MQISLILCFFGFPVFGIICQPSLIPLQVAFALLMLRGLGFLLLFPAFRPSSPRLGYVSRWGWCSLFYADSTMDITAPFDLLLGFLGQLVSFLRATYLQAFGARVSLFDIALASMIIGFLLFHFLPYGGDDE